MMNELSQKLGKEQQKYSSFKLMFVNRNVEMALADSLGAAEGITVLFFNHGMSYKYRGILRVQDILSSVDYFMSLVAEDLPLRRIGNSDDLKTFLGSTDKAVILLESCGWTSELLVQNTGNDTVQGMSNNHDYLCFYTLFGVIFQSKHRYECMTKNTCLPHVFFFLSPTYMHIYFECTLDT